MADAHTEAARPVVPPDFERLKILGLTIWQPWAWCISHGFKLVENRTWEPPKAVIGKYIAIHAAQKSDLEAVPDVQFILGMYFDERLRKLIGDDGELELGTMPRGAITAVARLAGVVTSREQLEPQQRPWWRGPVGWVLEDVVSLEPVPCRGLQKLWAVRPPVLDLVRKRYVAAKAARRTS